MFDTPTDWIIIAVIAALLFGGAKKIPDFARNLGRARGSFDLGKKELEKEMREAFMEEKND